MNPLLIVIPYCPKDSATADRLLDWIAELGGCKEACALLASDATVPPETIKALHAKAKKTFAVADAIVVQVPPAHEGWGYATKVMFESCANQIEQCYKLPWLWLEPDCVPLAPGWAESLAGAYHRSPRRFLGVKVTPASGPVHMAGPGIYPVDTFSSVKDALPSNAHFDLAISNYILPRMVDTPLIQHFWGKPDLAPTFKQIKCSTDAENVLPLSFIRKEAVLFHRDPSGSLIDLLRPPQKTFLPDSPSPIPAAKAIKEKVRT